MTLPRRFSSPRHQNGVLQAQEIAWPSISDTKPSMSSPTYLSKSSTSVIKSHRRHITIFLVAIGSLAILYQLFARVPALSSSITSALGHHSNICSADVGSDLCCDLYLGAEPCIEQCRQDHLDRQTLAITKEYDECADRCLVVYQSTCVSDGTRSIINVDDYAKEGAAGLNGPEVPS